MLCRLHIKLYLLIQLTQPKFQIHVKFTIYKKHTVVYIYFLGSTFYGPTFCSAIQFQPPNNVQDGINFYISSLIIISAKPSKFCPLHLSISSLLESVIDNPMPHMQSLTAHSAKTASPVAFSLAFNSGS